MTKILITGSSGFIGKHIVPRLADNFELYFLQNDLNDHQQVQNEILAASPDMVIHLAAGTI